MNIPRQPISGHSPREEGTVGTVVEADERAVGTHDVLVQFDEPVNVGPTRPGWAQQQDRMYYAASELEPSTD